MSVGVPAMVCRSNIVAVLLWQYSGHSLPGSCCLNQTHAVLGCQTATLDLLVLCGCCIDGDSCCRAGVLYRLVKGYPRSK